jgi:hypothetical protein
LIDKPGVILPKNSTPNVLFRSSFASSVEFQLAVPQRDSETGVNGVCENCQRSARAHTALTSRNDLAFRGLPPVEILDHPDRSESCLLLPKGALPEVGVD